MSHVQPSVDMSQQMEQEDQRKQGEEEVDVKILQDNEDSEGDNEGDHEEDDERDSDVEGVLQPEQMAALLSALLTEAITNPAKINHAKSTIRDQKTIPSNAKKSVSFAEKTPATKSAPNSPLKSVKFGRRTHLLPSPKTTPSQQDEKLSHFVKFRRNFQPNFQRNFQRNFQPEVQPEFKPIFQNLPLPTHPHSVYSNYHTVRCANFLKGVPCEYGNQCIFAHEALRERRSIPSNFKMKQCTHSDCRFGISCYNRHEGDTLQEMDQYVFMRNNAFGAKVICFFRKKSGENFLVE